MEQPFQRIFRRDAVHRLRQRLACNGHVVNADVSEVPDAFPIQSTAGVERKLTATVATFVSRVGSAGRETQGTCARLSISLMECTAS
jgi:hypothetical protein